MSKNKRKINYEKCVDRKRYKKIMKLFFKEFEIDKDYENVESRIFKKAVEKYEEGVFKNERNFVFCYKSIFMTKMVDVSTKFHRYYCMYLIDEIVEDKDLSRKLERSMYNGVVDRAVRMNVDRAWEEPGFVKMYREKIRVFLANLNPNGFCKNTKFLEKIKNGEYDIKTLGSIPETQWFPERIPKVVNDSIRGQIDQSAISSYFKCGKCKESKTVYYEQQTRSADESSTVFITCVVCGNRWKQN